MTEVAASSALDVRDRAVAPPESADLSAMLREWISRAVKERTSHPTSGSLVVPREAPDQELTASLSNLQHRFSQRLEKFDRRSRNLGALHTYGNVVVIAGGLITSGTIALGDPSKGWVQAFLIAVGLTVGVLTAINQIVRPGARSAKYAMAAASLRQEAWDLLLRMGRYSAASDDYVRTRRFLEEIREVNRAVDASVDKDLAPDLARGGADGRQPGTAV